MVFQISVGGKELTFKLDTGAEVTVITEEAHRMLEMPKLQKPSKALYGPTSTALRTLGQFTSTLSVNKKTSEETIFVVQGLKTNLLGLPAITSLQLEHVDDTLAQLAGATTFSKIDANSGFWQIPLEVESRLLTTFITPQGRYCFNKLPFGIASASELFQRRMSKILSGLPGVLCHMDDVLIFRTSQTEHDDRLTSVLQRLQAAGATLNKAKCEFGVHTVKFLGHIIDGKGLRAYPARLKAIQDLEQPKNVSELRRFMGMENQLGKFSPHLSEISQP